MIPCGDQALHRNGNGMKCIADLLLFRENMEYKGKMNIFSGVLMIV
jgi:hypothetical protein